VAIADLPAVRDRLVRLLTTELKRAWDKAISQGVTPDSVVAAVDGSRDALRDVSSPIPANDPSERTTIGD
jgi:hypothetical protein